MRNIPCAHIADGEREPFYKEAGTGKTGDIVFARALRASDAGYPSDQYLESESAGTRITLKQDEDNTITFIYKKMDPVIYRENSSGQDAAGDSSAGGENVTNPEGWEILPDTGDQTNVHRTILTMAAALCLAGAVLARRIHAFRA